MSVTFSSVSPNTSVTLPNPELGNSESLDLKSRHHLAMSAKVFTYFHTPAVMILNMQFQKLSWSEKEALITFMDATAGGIITLVNWLGETFAGRITNEPLVFTSRNAGDITSSAETGPDFYTVNITFEGSEET